MLHQELPHADLKPLDGWARWLVPALIAAAGLTAALVLFLLQLPAIGAAVFVAGLIAAAVVAFKQRSVPAIAGERLELGPDFSVVSAALGLTREPAALTS